MSGDVQPRKRKDKRRKKDAEYTIRRISSVSLDEDDSGTPPPPLVHAAEHASDHINLHIYKESSTGGHWCARIVFFILLAVLVGLIGLIIVEHRGTTDVDTPIESSRWAFVFDGWVDDSPPSHDDGEIHQEEEEEEDHGGVSEEIEDDELEHEDKEDEDNEEEHSDEGGIEASQEQEDADEEEEEEEDATLGYEQEEDEDNDGEEADENVSEDGNEENEDEEETDEPEEDEEEEENQSTQEGENVSTEMDNQVEDEDTEGNDGDLDFDDAGVLEELNIASEENIEDIDDDTLNDRDDEFDDNDDIGDGSEELKPAEMPPAFSGIPGVNEIDDDGPEPLEEVEGIEPEEVTEQNLEPEIEEEIEEESASVPVKFGVGVALVVAAHFVLIRRWNNVDLEASDFTGSPDLSRRTTIVPPPSTKVTGKNETEQSANKQSRNYETLRAKYNQLSTDNTSKNVHLVKSTTNGQSVEKTVSTAKEAANVKAQAQTKVFSSEEEEEEEDEGEELETSDAERVSGEEEFDYECDEYEEEVEEEEAAEDEEEEIENIDDSELIAKLEAKYGKLPTPQDSEEEVEEELEEEEEEEDEEIEDEDMEGWKRVNVPKHVGESRNPQKSGQTDTKNVGGSGLSHSSNRSRIDKP